MRHKIDVEGVKSRITDLAKEVVKDKGKGRKSDVLTKQEAAEYLKVSLVTLDTWRKGTVLIPYTVGRKVQYNIRDIDKLLENRVSGKLTKALSV